jgi:hypothetical protein
MIAFASTVVDLSRFQFATTSIYHFLFVPLTLGLAPLVAIMQTLWHRSHDDAWLRLTRFSGPMMTLLKVAQDLSRRLVATLRRGGDGRRPVHGRSRFLQDDPHWRDLILLYEYFHGDDGAGLGASHQTVWTGLVNKLIESLGQFTAAEVLTDNRWPLADPYWRLKNRPRAESASVG